MGPNEYMKEEASAHNLHRIKKFVDWSRSNFEDKQIMFHHMRHVVAFYHVFDIQYNMR